MDSIYPNLSQELDKIGLSVAQLATALNIPNESVLSKLRGDSPWFLSEALNVCRLLNNSDVRFLFLRLDNN